MKITDLALIFIGITLPLIIVVYVNVSFTIKAQEQEIYYQQIIDLAAQDASNQMKEVENEDSSIDYGYSGVSNNKISVNAQVGVDTFLNTLYNNFDIQGNDAAEHYLQLFIPAIAIIDYDGVQISSVETFKETDAKGIASEVTKHALKPKRYYTYTYSITGNSGHYEIVDGKADNYVSYHEIEFTMDDFIKHRGTYNSQGFQDNEVKQFYISDSKNNNDLISGVKESATDKDKIKKAVVDKLTAIRKDVIVNTVVKEMTYATNSNNSYARAAGITYDFSFPTTTQSDMYSSVENIGFLAFVQGISVGNKYLNTKAYGLTNLSLTTRYYFSVPSADSKIKMNLYHKYVNCPELRVSNTKDMTPRYVLTKQEAASSKTKVRNSKGEMETVQGFYPCPICNP